MPALRARSIGNLGAYESEERWKINNPPSPGRVLNFIVAAHFPFARVPDCPRPNHIQVDVCETPCQVAVTLYRRCVIPVLPERSSTLLS